MPLQPVQFSSVDDLLDFLPQHELQLVTRLRETVFDCLPFCIEKLAYNVPY